MRRMFAVLLLVLGLPLCASGARPVGAPPGRRVQFTPGQFIVKYRPGAAGAARTRLLSLTRAAVLGEIPQLGVQTLQFSSTAAVATLARSPEVAWIEPIRSRRLLAAPPDDPGYNEIDSNLPLDPDNATWYKWDSRIMQSLEGWSLWPNRYFTAAGKGAAEVRLAIIDTGIDYNHPDFRNAGAISSEVEEGGQLLRSLDRTWVSGAISADAWDEYGHGTHVAGIAGASTNNGIGTVGIGYNASLMSLRVLDGAGQGTSADVAAAIVYAADNGALICNLSLGDYEYSQAEKEAVDYAWDRGTLCIAAAGNDGRDDKPNYPAALPRVLAVAATAREERLALYSNYGSYLGCAAPGGDFDFTSNWFLPIYSTMPTYPVTLNGPDYGIQMNYDYLQGTSMASPQVAGLAALYAGSKGFTQSTPGVCLRIWRAIQLGCDNISGGNGNWDPVFGFGRVNVYNTLNLDAAPNPRGSTAGCITGQARYRGTLIQNAEVRAVPMGGGVTFTGSSRDDGGYRVANLPAGRYNVTATVFGESRTQTSVEVVAGADTPGLDFDVGSTSGNPPAAPNNLTAISRSDGGIDLSWRDNSSDENGFFIERSTDAGASFSQVATVAAGSTSFPSTGLSGNRIYHFRVRGYNDAGSSGYSNVAAALTYPAAPAGLSASAVAPTQIDLSWTDASGRPSAVKLERLEEGGAAYSLVTTIPERITTFSDSGLQAGKTYHYRARATNASGDSAYTGVVSATTPMPACSINLTSPSGGESWETGSLHDITWTSAGAGNQVKIELSTNGGEDWSDVARQALNNGAYTWTVPARQTTQARIRVSSLADPTCQATSAEFSIVAAEGGTLVLPRQLKFRKVPLGVERRRTFTIRNRSRTEGLRVSVLAPEAPFRLAGAVSDVLLPPRGIVRATVIFAPTARQNYDVELEIASSDPDVPIGIVELSGAGR